MQIQNLTDLPVEINFQILKYLTPKELVVIGLVCRYFNELTDDRSLWESHSLKDHSYEMAKLESPKSVTNFHQFYSSQAIWKQNITKAPIQPIILNRDSSIVQIDMNFGKLFELGSTGRKDYMNVMDLKGENGQNVDLTFSKGYELTRAMLTTMRLFLSFEDMRYKGILQTRDLTTGEKIDEGHPLNSSIVSMSYDSDRFSFLDDLDTASVSIWDTRQPFANRFKKVLDTTNGNHHEKISSADMLLGLQVDSVVHLWDVRKLEDKAFVKLSHRFEGHDGNIDDFYIDGDSRVLTFGKEKNSQKEMTCQWNPRKSNEEFSPRPITIDKRSMYSFGSITISHEDEEGLELYDRTSSQPIHAFNGFKSDDIGLFKGTFKLSFYQGVLVTSQHANRRSVIKIWNHNFHTKRM